MDIAEILEAMNGLPATIRLLDPPLLVARLGAGRAALGAEPPPA